MRFPISYLFGALIGVFLSSSTFADDWALVVDVGRASTLKVGDVAYKLPFTMPSKEEILRALPENSRPKNAQIQCELVAYRVNAPRFYPLVGPARLVEVRFKCTVSSNGKNQVVDLDRDHLIMEK